MYVQYILIVILLHISRRVYGDLPVDIADMTIVMSKNGIYTSLIVADTASWLMVG